LVTAHVNTGINALGERSPPSAWKRFSLAAPYKGSPQARAALLAAEVQRVNSMEEYARYGRIIPELGIRAE